MWGTPVYEILKSAHLDPASMPWSKLRCCHMIDWVDNCMNVRVYGVFLIKWTARVQKEKSYADNSAKRREKRNGAGISDVTSRSLVMISVSRYRTWQHLKRGSSFESIDLEDSESTGELDVSDKGSEVEAEFLLRANQLQVSLSFIKCRTDSRALSHGCHCWMIKVCEATL